MARYEVLKSKNKICHRCQKLKPLWRSNPPTCAECDQIIKALQGQKPAIKPPKQIKPISTKRAKLDRLYSVARAQFLKDHQLCQASVVSKCGHKATEVHHKRGRGVYYLDITTWLAVCEACHRWIEEHPEEAKAKGLSENRLDKYDDKDTTQI